MVLIPATLTTGLRGILDPSFEGFGGFPGTEAVGQRWADAIDAYAALVTPPTTTAPVAKEALVLALGGLSIPGAALAVFDAAFASYATTLALGMAPVFLGIPPPLPVSIALGPELAILSSDGAVKAAAISAILDAWFRTGSAVLISLGNVVPWT